MNVEPATGTPSRLDATGGRRPADGERGDLHKLAVGSVLSLGGLVANGILGLMLVIVITRGLRAAGAGVFFQAIAAFTILSTVADVGATTGLVRTLSRYRVTQGARDLRRALFVGVWPSVAAATIIAAGIFLLAPVISEPLGIRGAKGVAYIRLLAPFLPVAVASNLAVSATRGFGTVVPYVLVENILKPFLRPVFSLAAIAMGFGALVVALAWVMPVALGFPLVIVILGIMMRRAESEGPLDMEPRGSVRQIASEFWRFAIPRGVARIFEIGILWADVLLIGALRSPAEAGIYAAVSRLVTFGIFAMEAVRLALAPQISSLLARQDREGAQNIFRVGTWWPMAVSWPLYLTLAIFAPLVLGLFGPEFVMGQTALLILALAMLIAAGAGHATVVLLMGGRSVWNLGNTAVALVVNVTLNLILIPRFGMNGAAIAWAVSITINNVAPLVQVRSLFRLSPFGPGFVIVAVASATCFAGWGVVVRSVAGTTLSAFLVFAIVAVGLYLSLLTRFRSTLHLSSLLESLVRRATRSPWR